MTVDPKVQIAAEIAGEHLDQIVRLFKPGMLAALVVWHPTHNEREFVLHSPETTIDEAIKALERRRDDPHNVFGHTKP